jgi:hypothetical protein
MGARAGRRRRRPTGVLAAIGIVLVAVVVGVPLAFVAATQVLHGPVDARSLHDSVEEASGSAAGGLLAAAPSQGDCTPRDDRWRCEVADAEDSGTAVYVVRVEDGSCWRGRLVRTSGEDMPPRIDGCVHLLEVQLFD